MIVDDDRITVSLLKTLLELDGYEVVNISRGLQVLDKALQDKPDLIMLDYNLNDTSGIEVVRRLRAHQDFQKTPIIVASGMNVEAEVSKAGANAFMVKPLEPNKLSALIKKLIEAQ
jgi:DNA-binding response OmpR family regulator